MGHLFHRSKPLRKTILTFGFISGGVLSVVMLASIPFMDTHDARAYIIGYSSMVLAFLLVYFGVRSYRENVGGGIISFGRAFGVGIGITAIGCCCYVATWEFIYYKITPDFMEKYAAHELDSARKAGASDAALEKKRDELAKFNEMYKNPVVNVAMTFIEPLPVGVLMTLLAAG